MDSIQIKNKQFEPFITEDDLLKSINQIADQLNEEYRDKSPVFVCILTGAFMFASEILKRFKWDCEVTFMRLKSYDGTESKGEVRELQGFVEKLEGRDVIVLEDIIETGKTMTHLLEKMKDQNPASIRIASLFFKPNALQKEIHPDYVAFEIGNDFIVGFGLDYDGYGRNLQQIYKVK
jgi:hypoxanthine phosphoribosyltransferase